MSISWRASAPVASSLLLVVLAFLPQRGVTQEKLPEAAPKTEPQAAAAGLITLGTTRARVDQLLGSPPMGWTINCLARSMFTYPDGSKIIFVDDRVISARPNGLAKGSPDVGLIVEHGGKEVVFEPMVLCGVPIEGPLGDLKRQVETCFFRAPPSHSLAVIPQPLWVNPTHPWGLRPGAPPRHEEGCRSATSFPPPRPIQGAPRY